MLSLEDLILHAKDARASDIHIASGKPILVRIDGQLVQLTETAISPEDCEEFAISLVGEKYTQMRECGEADGGVTCAGNRCRVHVYRQQGQVSIALRLLNMNIPDMETLRLPAAVHKFPDYKRGIVLVTGQTGAGKSTTLAAVLDRINHTYYKHIVTLEDPIEYLYQQDKCLISQRQIGSDTTSFAEGLRASLREDPDVILVGEMRDPETVEIALTAAETGHLVFATLHTNSA
ncbi:MAG: Flp pilus assembly complex ATPase component TadA, partial [Clostridia bacterium]|nr:Flp pilus assembly complex ATPase component TadA [Clostridia bacterium]